MKLGQFTQYSISTLFTNFVLLFISAGISVITARVLGPEGRGLLTLILLIPMISSTFGKMGVGHAINFFANKTDRKSIIIDSFVLISLLSIILVVVVLPISIQLKSVVFKGISEKTIISICLLIPFYLIHYQQASLLQSFYLINIRNILQISKSLLNISFLIILIIILKLNVTGAVLSSVSSLIITVLFMMYYFSKEINFTQLMPNWHNIRKLLNFGYKSHIGNILKDLSYKGDILIVSYFLSPRYVGYYAIAVTLAEIILRIPDAIGTVLLPRVANMPAKESKYFTPKVCRIVLIPIVIISAIIILMSNQIVFIAFGKDYLPSSSALMFLMPGVIALAIWKIISNDLIAQGYPLHYSVSSAIGVLTMICFDILLIPIYGIAGAAIASSLSYIAATFAIVVIYINITNNPIKSILIPLKTDFVIYLNILKVIPWFRA